MEETRLKEPAPYQGVGIYGWRKRCLYVILILLTLVVSINVTLILWIIKVLQINSHGMTDLQVVGSGLQIPERTKAAIMDTLVMSGLFSRDGQTLSFQSGENITLRTLDNFGHLTSSIYLGEGRLDLKTPNFKVMDFRGKTLFSADKDTIYLTTPSLLISGEGGTKLEGSLQTAIVSADIRSDLVLESPTKGVQAVTPAGVSIESRAGDISVSSYQDISLITIDGSIKLESSNVLLPTLREPQHSHRTRRHRRHRSEKIYQLCVCGQGDLYLGEADSFCRLEHMC